MNGGINLKKKNGKNISEYVTMMNGKIHINLPMKQPYWNKLKQISTATLLLDMDFGDHATVCLSKKAKKKKHTRKNASIPEATIAREHIPLFPKHLNINL